MMKIFNIGGQPFAVYKHDDGAILYQGASKFRLTNDEIDALFAHLRPPAKIQRYVKGELVENADRQAV